MKSSLFLSATLMAFCLIVSSINAQEPNKNAGEGKVDSNKKNFVEQMKAFAKQSAQKSADEFEADKAVLAQGKLLEEIKKNVQESKIFLEGFRDSVAETATLNRIESHYVLAGDGVFTNKGSVQTYRNLTATAKIWMDCFLLQAIIKRHWIYASNALTVTAPE